MGDRNYDYLPDDREQLVDEIARQDREHERQADRLGDRISALRSALMAIRDDEHATEASKQLADEAIQADEKAAREE